MPQEPIRERTMAAIAEQLGTIQAGTVVYTVPIGTKAGRLLDDAEPDRAGLCSGCRNTISRSSRARRGRSSISGPVLGVVRASGSSFERMIHTDPAGPVVRGL